MIPDPKQLRIKDFTYHLPDEKIAKFPLPNRSDSKLLYYHNGKIEDFTFPALPNLLPPSSLLVFNNTKVVKARLFFQRPSGSTIEIFCLEPVAPTAEMQLAMQQTGSCVWKCLIGNAKRWKEESLNLVIAGGDEIDITVTATKGERLEDSFIIQFTWNPAALTFAEILEKAGNLPLPPYLNREAIETDKQTYQTVYARQDGAVAAPTAGLHFTEEIFTQLAQQNHKRLEVTLHVGAGTFKPVKAEAMADHTMHGEELIVTEQAIREILTHFPNLIIPVGTTSMRTLESLYWLGMQLHYKSAENSGPLLLDQWFPYADNPLLTQKEALNVILDYLKTNQLDQIRATTQLLIAPGYRFKLINGLITNFHQPESTLLLLVSALIGEDWRRVYHHALENHYRFLSYGDSSLLLP